MINAESWKERLTADQYRVLREKATEPPFSGSLLYNKDSGSYLCAGCGNKLFDSSMKFDCGSGWPSFNDVIDSNSIRIVDDTTHNLNRQEVMCAKCQGHLGHLFDDATALPTTKRYCINSLSLEFKKETPVK